MIGFALLGCGRIGTMHARNIAAHPRAELVACYDVAAGAAKDTAKAHGAEAVSSVERILADNRVRAVLIASSTDTHVELIKEATKAGKAVLCEKPVDLDMARYLAGDIVEVQAMGASLIDPAIRELGDIDAAMVIMRAASGALVHINNSRRCVYGHDQRIEVFGGRGMLQAGNCRATTVEAWDAGRTRAQDSVLEFFVQRYQAAYEAELDQFVACVEGGAAPLAGFAEGREALRLADAALESLKAGRTVRVVPSGGVAVQEAAA